MLSLFDKVFIATERGNYLISAGLHLNAEQVSTLCHLTNSVKVTPGELPLRLSQNLIGWQECHDNDGPKENKLTIFVIRIYSNLACVVSVRQVVIATERGNFGGVVRK